MQVTLKDIASIINGKVFGNSELIVSNIAPIENAKSGDISFVANKKYLKYLADTKATAVIIDNFSESYNVAQIVVENPYLAYAKLLTKFTYTPTTFIGVSEKAYLSDSVLIKNRDLVSIFPFVYISENVEIGERTIIHSNVFIGKNVKIGSNCIIHPNVSIYKDCIIKNSVTVHSGTVIGSDGYGYARDGEQHFKIPQIGNVVIEDDVEIGANCTIDRAALNSTIINRGVKIDNLVHIAHNVEIGQNSLIIAQVGISGSSKIGDNVILAGQVGVAGHLKIGNNVIVGAQSGIGRSIDDGSVVSGSPAINHSQWLKWAVKYQDLPELIKRVSKLEKLVSGEKNV